jgi:hypothetical protein
VDVVAAGHWLGRRSDALRLARALAAQICMTIATEPDFLNGDAPTRPAGAPDSPGGKASMNGYPLPGMPREVRRSRDCGFRFFNVALRLRREVPIALI